MNSDSNLSMKSSDEYTAVSLNDTSLQNNTITKTSTISAISSLCTIMLGVGIYYTPYTFANTDTIKVLIALIVVLLFSCISNFALFYSAHAQNKINMKRDQKLNTPINDFDIEEGEQSVATQSDKLSYSSIGSGISKYIGGMIGAMRVTVCFAVCLFFQKFIFSVIKTNAIYFTQSENSLSLDIILMSLINGILILVGSIKDMNKYSFLAKFNVIVLILICAKIVGLSLFLKGMPMLKENFNDNGDFMFSFGNFIFALSCQLNIIDLYNTLETNNLLNLAKISILSPALCAFFYGIVGYMGARILENSHLKIDLINLLADPMSLTRNYIIVHCGLFGYIFIYLIQAMAIISLIISFAYVFNVVKQAFSIHVPLKQSNKRFSILIVASISIMIMTIINLMPNISLDIVFSLIANVMCIPLSYIFPAIFALKYGGKSKMVRVFAIAAILLASSFALYNFITPLVNNNSPVDIPQSLPTTNSTFDLET